MDWLWIIFLLVIGYFLFIRTRSSSASGFTAEEKVALDNVLKVNGFDTNAVKFSSYTDRDLIGDEPTVLFVGSGVVDGAREGFYAEIKSDEVLEFKVIHPSAAMRHRECARKALSEPSRLKYELVEQSLIFNTRDL